MRALVSCSFVVAGFALLCLVIWLVGRKNERRFFRGYWSRVCTGFRWKRQFPDVPKGEIRAFLLDFTQAFVFDDDKGLKFDPNDKLLDIYNTRYPASERGADMAELETLHLALEEKYGIDLATAWGADLTLGQVFALTRQKTCPAAQT